jgi:putative hydrolase of the HAD superfamily
MLDWTRIDTVLLDMDGTLLDLEFDNTLWNHRLPERYAERNRISHDDAREQLFAHMRQTRTRLEFYCLDYWARYTQLDIVGLHVELSHLIRYRPQARSFLDALERHGKRILMVTNAHRDSLAIKDRMTGVVARLHRAVSSHDFSVPKERPEFWARLAELEPFDPSRTLLIDDNADVLDSAAAHGIAHLRTIAQPDSARPPRTSLRHAAIDRFEDVMP